MSKTMDDLIAVFEKACAEAAPFPQHHEDGLYAGIAAVVRALRDELSKCDWDEGENMIDALDEILGSDAGEKVAGGSTREDEQAAQPSSTTPATPKDEEHFGITVGREFPATDTAPAVCVWTGEEYVTYSTSCESEHEVDPHKAPPTYCPSCGKPIAFTEANHG